MAKNFRELEAKMPPEARARSDAKAKKMVREMALAELREARKLTQVELAKALRVNQAAVSKLESRSDMYVSTLRKTIRAMGGELQLRATFRTGEVNIRQLTTVERRPVRRRAVARKRR
jgi:transcriptional regulator with XRE-family HTH domain